MSEKKPAPPVFETVLYETKGPICYITLNRPEKLNAASDQLVEEVNDALFEFDADRSSTSRSSPAPAASSARAPTSSSVSSARPRRCAGSAGLPGAARGRTGSATPSTGSR